MDNDTEWKSTTVGKSYKFTSKPRGIKPSEVAFIPMAAISDKGEYIHNSLIKRVKKVASGTYVENGDLILAKITPSFENGKQAIVNIDEPFAYASTEVIPIKEIEDISDKWFLAYWLRQKEVRAYLAGKMEGTTGRQRLSKAVLSRKAINLPPLSEQREIAKTLSTIQHSISEQEKVILELLELKRSLMHYVFTKGVKGEGTESTILGDLPKSWRILELGKTGAVSYGIQAAVASLLNPIGYKIITNKNITIEGNITFEKVNYFEPKSNREVSSFVENGDLLLNWRSGSKEHVGKTAIYFGEEKLLHSSFILRIRTDPRIIINKYLYYYLNWLRGNGYFVKLQSYSVNAKFNKSSVLSMQIAVPDLIEQMSILEILDRVTSSISYTQLKQKTYSQLFSTLLHELMSGKRRVKIND
jgi:type I restriction enzyme S subunit